MVLILLNLDAIFDFMFTRAADTNKSLLFFADICSGPGGFTEYILWRKKWHAKGYGYTLEGELDFKIGRFNPESPWDTFYPYYGVDGTARQSQNLKSRPFLSKWRKIWI